MTKQEARERVVQLREQMRDDHEAMTRLHNAAEAEGRDFRPSEQEEFGRRSARFDRNAAERNRLEAEHGLGVSNGAVEARHAGMNAQGAIRHEVEGDMASRTQSGSQGALTLSREQRMSDWTAAHGRGGDYSAEDVRSFSLGRAIRAAATGDWRAMPSSSTVPSARASARPADSGSPRS